MNPETIVAAVFLAIIMGALRMFFHYRAEVKRLNLENAQLKITIDGLKAREIGRYVDLARLTDLREYAHVRAIELTIDSGRARRTRGAP